MDINNLEMIGQGNTAEIYAYEGNKILKLFRDGMPKEAAANEYEKAVFIQTYIPNAPKADEFVKHDECYGIIYERVNGEDLIKVMIKSIPKINSYSRMLARVHREIHQSHVKADGDLLTKNKLTDDIEAAEAISDRQKERVISYLNQLPDGDSLCHFDFHPGNIMIQDQEPIVIDWMTACVGNPCADIARTYIILTYGELPSANYFVRKLISLFQKHVGKVYFREYLRLSQFDEQEIEKWLLPVAAARLREWIPDSEKKALLAFIDTKIASI